MAFLDVTDILLDPDFCDTGIVCNRNIETISNQGLATITPSQTTFTGVVTNDNGDTIRRMADAERTVGNINIRTKFRLQDGSAGRTADTIVWQGRTYTVSNVKDFTNYGQGFVVATCDLLPVNQ